MHSSRCLVSACCFVAVLCVASAEPVQAAFINLTPQGNAVNSQDSISLSDLQAGDADGVVVGDKTFSGFSYSRIGDMPVPEDVRVLGFRDSNGNWGISFHGAFVDLPGGGSSDAVIRFMVEVDPAAVAEGILITDANLFIGGAGVGSNSSFTVDESFQLSNELLNAYVTSLGDTTEVQSFDSASLATPRAKLFVTKDIFAFAGEGATLPARATVIDQSFTQIPEPATAVLVGLVLAGMAIVRRGRG